MEQRDKAKKDIKTRLRRIEGQVKGIQRMVDEDASCREILIQVAAIRSAINKVGCLILENYAENCFLYEDDNKCDSEKIQELTSTLTMFLK